MNSNGLTTRLARQPFRHLTTLRFWRLISGMNYFLFCVEKPLHETQRKEWEFWRTVSSRIADITKPIAGVQKPCENVWLIPATKGVGALGDCIQTCQSQGQKYQVLFVQMEICE
jgi:hypothetical protein